MNAVHTEEDIDDLTLISRILNGEPDEYAHIVRRYNAYLYRIGRTYGYGHSDTEDLMQDTYINVYTNLKKFEKRSTFKTWLTRIMLHNCYHKKHLLRNQKEYIYPDFSAEEKSQPMFTNHHEDTDQKVDNNELTRLLEDAVLSIPEDYRMIFTLRELNGLSIKEAALALRLTESNVKVKLHRAKAMLKKELLKSYQADEIFEFNLIYCEPMVERVMAAIEGVSFRL